MKIVPECPAAHSMDTAWFAVDERGQVGMFATHEIGALPHDALADQEGDLEGEIVAAALAAKLKSLKWSRTKRDVEVEEVALIAASKPTALRSFVSAGHLERVSSGAPAIFRVVEELDGDEELLEQILAEPDCLGFLTRDAVDAKAGFFRFETQDIPGQYVKEQQGSLRAKDLPAALAKKLGRMKLPVNFARTETVNLWEHISEDDVTLYEEGLAWDGGIQEELDEAIEAASERRRFEFSEGSSQKFWEISVEGSATHVRFGKLGTAGQELTKKFSSPEDAVADSERLVREKTNKGYVAVLADSAKPPGAAKASSTWTPVDAATEEFRGVYGVRFEGRTPPAFQKSRTQEKTQVFEALVQFSSEPALEQALQHNGLAEPAYVRPASPFYDLSTLKLPMGRALSFDNLGGLEFERHKKEITARYANRISSKGAQWLYLVVARGEGADLAELWKEEERRKREQQKQKELDDVQTAATSGNTKVLLEPSRRELVKRQWDQLVQAAIEADQWKSVDALTGLVTRPRAIKVLTDGLAWSPPNRMRQLLKRGADPRLSRDDLFDPTDVETARLLIASGWDVETQEDGLPPLQRTRDPAIVRELLKAGASVNARSKTGSTALVTALSFIDEDSEALVKLLLAAGADATRKLEGRTPIEILDAHVAGRVNDKAKTKARAERIKALLQTATSKE